MLRHPDEAEKSPTDRPLDILLVSHRFAGPKAAGTEILTLALARGLTDRGLRVTWMAADSPEPEYAGGSRQISIPPLGLNSVADWRTEEALAAAAVEAALDGEPQPDVVHMTHFSRTGLAFLDTPALSATPVVATLTDYTLVCPDHQLWQRQTRTLCRSTAGTSGCLNCLDVPAASFTSVDTWRRRNLHWLNSRVEAFWVQTPHQAAELAAAGAPMGKLVSDRARYNLPIRWADAAGNNSPGGQAPYFLFVGRCSPEKGLDVLLDGYAAWSGTERLVIAALADDPEHEAQLRAKAASDPRINWRDPLPREQLGALISGAAAVLIPSQWYENHPLVLDEARALGVPAWCSAVASLRHLADEPGVHLVEDYANPSGWTRAFAVISADANAHRLPQFAALASAFDAFVDDTVNVYRKVVAQFRTQRA